MLSANSMVDGFAPILLEDNRTVVPGRLSFFVIYVLYQHDS